MGAALTHTCTHTQTLGRLEATRVTQFSMVDSIELRTEVGQGQEAAHVAQLVAAGSGQRQGQRQWGTACGFVYSVK